MDFKNWADIWGDIWGNIWALESDEVATPSVLRRRGVRLVKGKRGAKA